MEAKLSHVCLHLKAKSKYLATGIPGMLGRTLARSFCKLFIESFALPKRSPNARSASTKRISFYCHCVISVFSWLNSRVFEICCLVVDQRLILTRASQNLTIALAVSLILSCLAYLSLSYKNAMP